MSLSFDFSGVVTGADNDGIVKSISSGFKGFANNPQHGFFNFLLDDRPLETCRQVYSRFKKRKHFVHIGMGGSSLGAQALVSALGRRDCVTFISNIDPEEVTAQLASLDVTRSLFYIVSKSGSTVETMALFSVVAKRLQGEGILPENFGEYFVFATDPNTSDLLNLGNELNITCLAIPSNVGGRFSALTVVGLLPSLFAGVDCQELLDGAKRMRTDLSGDIAKHPICKMARNLATLAETGIKQTVLMPYSSRLKLLSYWFVQLWAESLGKEKDLNGEIVNRGLTPIAAYGTSDQHSQLQLFLEGPTDKCVILIGIDNFTDDLELTDDLDSSTLKTIKGHTLSALMEAHRYGTSKSLQDAERPYMCINMEDTGAASMGQLIFFLHSLTVLMGCCFNINPFDQPAVEAGKRYALEHLSQQ